MTKQNEEETTTENPERLRNLFLSPLQTLRFQLTLARSRPLCLYSVDIVYCDLP